MERQTLKKILGQTVKNIPKEKLEKIFYQATKTIVQTKSQQKEHIHIV